MITRKEYLNGDYTYDEYYSQFVNDFLIDRVEKNIGIERIVESEDLHFYDIPLKEWDNLGPLPDNVKAQLKKAGDFIAPSVNVSVYKTTARIIKSNHS